MDREHAEILKYFETASANRLQVEAEIERVAKENCADLTLDWRTCLKSLTKERFFTMCSNSHDAVTKCVSLQSVRGLVCICTLEEFAITHILTAKLFLYIFVILRTFLISALFNSGTILTMFCRIISIALDIIKNFSYQNRSTGHYNYRV